MLKKLEEIYWRNSFHPSRWAVLWNPFYFIRGGLSKAIHANAYYMRGCLLDFGCGSQPYRPIFHVEEYIGVDIEVSGHQHVNSHVDVFYDGQQIPFEDNHFDSVFTSEVFEHVFNLDQVLDELHRVLKVNGYMLLTVPFVWDEHEVPYDFARYSSFGLTYLLEKHGFEVVVAQKTTNYVETIAQLWMAYLFQCVLPHHPLLKIPAMLLTTTPIAIMGTILSRILPDRQDLYLNNVMVVRKLPPASDS